jgi:uncharacterized protein YdaU (DUF1376 family)
MSSLDGMMLWTDDYLADTMHLTTIQHGAYLLILMAMWRAGGRLPNDERRLAKIARLPLNRWRKIYPEIQELLVFDTQGVTQKRLWQELQKTRSLVEKKGQPVALGPGLKR